MATIEVDVRDYVTDERITEIVEDEIRYFVRGYINRPHVLSDWLGNISYATARNLVCEELKISQREFESTITNRIREILDNPDTLKFEVFRRKSEWNQTESPAVKYLYEVLTNSKPKIEAAVNKILEEYPFPELREEINDTIYFCIMRKLSEKGSDE